MRKNTNANIRRCEFEGLYCTKDRERERGGEGGRSEIKRDEKKEREERGRKKREREGGREERDKERREKKEDRECLHIVNISFTKLFHIWVEVDTCDIVPMPLEMPLQSGVFL